MGEKEGLAVAAGPSEAGPSKDVSDEDLARASENFDEGLQALRDNDLSEAVDKFAAALEVRVAKYGGTALECASAYYRYGSALFYKAQEESDVFGAPLLEATTSERVSAAAIKQQAEDADAEKENRVNKGKAKVVEPAGEPVGDESGDEEEGEGGGERDEASETDMQLAWQMLEIARTIYSKQAAAHMAELADVHLLLGDISMEEENFDAALSDYRTGLDYRRQVTKEPNRRTAEMEYKIALALQYLNDPDEALVACRAAVATCRACIIKLRTRHASAQKSQAAPSAPPAAVQGNETLAAGPAPSNLDGPTGLPVAVQGNETLPAGGPALSNPDGQTRSAGAAAKGLEVAEGSSVPAQGNETLAPGPLAEAGVPSEDAMALGKQEEVAANAGPHCLETIEKEISDLESVMEELTEKLQELCESIALMNSHKEAVKSAFSQLSSLMGGGAGDAAPSFGSRPSGAPDQDQGPAFGSRPSGAPVQDLGVVGRGNKRIQLVPQGTSMPSAPTAGGAAVTAPSAAKPKRSLDDLMGGTSGETTIGFGSAPGAVEEPKRAKVEANPLTAADGAKAADPKPSLPAFLQPANVAAVYGKANDGSNAAP